MPPPNPATVSGHAVIAGYGVPGRAVAEWMSDHHIPFVVIEQNEQIVDRCGRTGVSIIQGDVSSEKTLRQAGIERASIFAVAIPVEERALLAVPIARRLNATMRIIVRCSYTSSGMEAIRAGADEVLVAEQIVAREFSHVLNARLPRPTDPVDSPPPDVTAHP